ncbi:hypothetical protein [Pseudomonas sp. PD9R]|uniref:hypothetical protein n=1 Tax=Pseudomonas sp. PD9R TaxID=2853534 RepID=UPI001C46A517|nr:hypothetical protein [Pseudomonas sp. PD9R]MBV6822935.1 hypothetical protein [Pseudomonas sp. PD9R]
MNLRRNKHQSATDRLKGLMQRSPVGAAEGCDLSILLLKNQKIAAFGSSYSGVCSSCVVLTMNLRRNKHQSATDRLKGLMQRSPVGAAAGCDLSILLLKTKSKDRSLRQLLQWGICGSCVVLTMNLRRNKHQSATDRLKGLMPRSPVGAAEGCDLLILLLKTKSKAQSLRQRRQEDGDFGVSAALAGDQNLQLLR